MSDSVLTGGNISEKLEEYLQTDRGKKAEGVSFGPSGRFFVLENRRYQKLMMNLPSGLEDYLTFEQHQLIEKATFDLNDNFWMKFKNGTKYYSLDAYPHVKSVLNELAHLANN